MADGSRSGPWVISLAHKYYSGSTLDLSEFAEGSESKTKPRNWTSDFKGRPGLLADLLPSLKILFTGLSPKQTPFRLFALRAFFRYLDARERYFASQGIDFQEVAHLHQISGATFDSWLHPGPNGAWKAAPPKAASSIRGLIELAIQDLDLDPILTSSISQPRTVPRDTATDEEGLALIRYLRSCVMNILRRWQRADAQAAAGRDLARLYKSVGSKGVRAGALGRTTEADAHATFRAFIATSGIPVPTQSMFLEHLGFKGAALGCITWWPHGDASLVGWEQLVSGLYPDSRDVSVIALYCIARMAWNPCTLFAINVDDWHAPYDDRHVWIYAQKVRARGAFQHAVSNTTQISGTYSIIQKLIARSSPLREWARADPKIHPAPNLVLRSPFVGVSLRRGRAPLYVADTHDQTLGNWLKACIQAHNQLSGTIHIRDITPSDFRDIAAAVMYRDSRYSMWVLQLLLGHKSQRSTILYGHRHASRQESRRKILAVVENTLDQARATGKLDPALTRARIEAIDVTPAARARLESFRAQRTYSGAVCESPNDPPKHIDPAHPRDGRAPCAQGHVCVARACPRATVLPDSLDAIARSVAELEWRRARSGAVRWTNSSAPSDLQNLLNALKQWPSAEVNRHLDIWRSKISSGQHLPLSFGGAHASQA